MWEHRHHQLLITAAEGITNCYHCCRVVVHRTSPIAHHCCRVVVHRASPIVHHCCRVVVHRTTSQISCGACPCCSRCVPLLLLYRAGMLYCCMLGLFLPACCGHNLCVVRNASTLFRCVQIVYTIRFGELWCLNNYVLVILRRVKKYFEYILIKYKTKGSGHPGSRCQKKACLFFIRNSRNATMLL